MRVPVFQQRDVVRRIVLHPKESSRSISRALGVAANTVLSLREAFESSGLSGDVLEKLDDRQWSTTLGTVDRSIAQRKEAPKWSDVHEQMGLSNATLWQLWTEFKEAHPEGIAFTQFSVGYRKYTRRLDIVMRQVHVPGQKMFSDFCGKTVHIRDPEGGPGFDAQIFVSVLGHSNYTFAMAVSSQGVQDWNACHVAAFEFFGGVAEWTVSDNLKAAVISNRKDELVVNKAHRECLTHYGTHALPRRVRKPKENSKAECGVQLVQRWILFALRNRTFFSLSELNAEIRRLLTLLNTRPFKKLPGCRNSRYQEVERAALQPLPSLPFEPREWRFEVLVGADHVFEHEKCFYSVPCELRNERVDLRITATVIEAMHCGKRVALHERKRVAGEVSMVQEHRPIAHRRVLEGEPKALFTWAASAGEATSAMFQYHLRDRVDLTNGLRTARRLRELAREHGEQRFEEVCVYAVALNMTSLKSVTSILKNAPDKRNRDGAPAPRPPHSNVRGATYFGDET
jgi:transposase